MKVDNAMLRHEMERLNTETLDALHSVGVVVDGIIFVTTKIIEIKKSLNKDTKV